MTKLADLVQHEPPLSTGATAVYPYSPSLERLFRFTSRFGEEVLLHKVQGDTIHLPRAVCPVGGIDNRVLGLRVTYPKAPEPRPHQIALFAATEEFLLKGQSGIVVAQTGFGKTLIGFHAASVVKRKTLVITTKDDIYQQWINGAKQFLGLEDHEIGEIRQNKCQVQGTKFVVAMIHSLAIESKYPDWIDEEFGLVIYDETHRLAAEHFAKAASLFRAKLRLGLSADEKRADGKELLIYAHIGNVRARSNVELMVPKVLRYDTQWKCPRSMKIDKKTGVRSIQKIPHEAGKTTFIDKMLAGAALRNSLITKIIKAGLAKNRKIVVFSSLVAHLKTLQAAAIALGVPSSSMGLYIGAAGKEAIASRDEAKQKPLIFTTYSMMSEGTDIPWLDMCILATPRSNVIQPTGRIRREHEGKPVPVLVDLVDGDSPVFAGYAENRLRWYNKIRCEIVNMQ